MALFLNKVCSSSSSSSIFRGMRVDCIKVSRVWAVPGESKVLYFGFRAQGIRVLGG